jgi:PadR family transcriptional regulator
VREIGGRVAQLGERRVRNAEVASSILAASTRLRASRDLSASHRASRYAVDSSLTKCKTAAVPGRRTTVPRLSAKETLILELLSRDRESYGLQLVAASKGRLKRGTVYVTLGRMEDKGYVRSRAEDAPDGAGGLPRRLYEATPQGARVLKAWTFLLRRLAPEPAR